MYSVKPGRGPSLMAGISGILVALFGVCWTALVIFLGVPFMAVFGVLFVGIALCGAFYNLYNSTQRNRFSALDVTTGEEEPDPLGRAMERALEPTGVKPCGNFCAYCGVSLEDDFKFCPKCGREVQ